MIEIEQLSFILIKPTVLRTHPFLHWEKWKSPVYSWLHLAHDPKIFLSQTHGSFHIRKMELRDGCFQTVVATAHTKSSTHRWRCTGSVAARLMKGIRHRGKRSADIDGRQSSPRTVTCAFFLAPHRVRCRCQLASVLFRLHTRRAEGTCCLTDVLTLFCVSVETTGWF